MKQCWAKYVSTYHMNDMSWVDRYLSHRDMSDIMNEGLREISSYDTNTFEYLAWDHTSEINGSMKEISNNIGSFDNYFDDYDSDKPLSVISDYSYTNGFKNFVFMQRIRHTFYAVCEETILNL